MARVIAELPKGTRLSDYISLGVLSKMFPVSQVKTVLAEQGNASQRQRDLPAHVVVYYVIALALFMQVSYREVLRCLLEGWAWLLGPGQAVKVTGKSGISQARTRLGWEVMRQLHEEVVKPIAVAATQGAWYRRWRLVSLDGSTLDVADEKENERAFGRPSASRGSSAYPQLRFVSLVENGTHVLFGTRWAGYATGEITLARRSDHGAEKGDAVLGGPELFRLRVVESSASHGSRSAVAGEEELALGGGAAFAGWVLPQPHLSVGARPAASGERRHRAGDRLSVGGHRGRRADLSLGDDDARPSGRAGGGRGRALS
jgi:Insertion element 4 transposase N-terminal